jgi:hypothetical protein
VANIEGAADPSHGRNAVKVRTGFTRQHVVEVPRGVADERVLDARTPGAHTHLGLLTWTTPGVPVGASATVEVVDTDFTTPTTLLVGNFTVTSGDDFDVTTGTPHVGEDITDTPPDGMIVVWKTAGATEAEGAILVPAHVPMEPGGVGIGWVSGAVVKTQMVDADGVFTGDGNPTGSSINFTTGAITLDTTGAAPDVSTGISITYTATVSDADIATNLAAAIDGLPGFSAAAVAEVVTVTGPAGPDGNELRCSAVYRGTVQNYSITPTNGFLGDGLPRLGSPVILP